MLLAIRSNEGLLASLDKKNGRLVLLAIRSNEGLLAKLHK